MILSIIQTLSSNIPALLCLIVGYGLLMVELCIPGFGVLGFSGIALMTAGILLGTASLYEALLLAGIMLALVLIALPFCFRMIAKGKFDRTGLVLEDVSVAGSEKVNPLNRFLNQEGVALTALRPSGLGEFDGEKIDVVSSGNFIEEGAHLIVERVEGNRVVVTNRST